MKRSLSDTGLTLRSEKRKVIVGKIRHDRLKYTNYVCLGRHSASHFIFDELAKVPEGTKVRVTIEVLDAA